MKNYIILKRDMIIYEVDKPSTLYVVLFVGKTKITLGNLTDLTCNNRVVSLESIYHSFNIRYTPESKSDKVLKTDQRIN